MTQIPVEIEALKYLHQPETAFWRWTDDGGAIQWFDGSTIVFTAELLAILRHQHAGGTRGLPPLGAVVLLIAATRENWSHGVSSDINPQRRNWLIDNVGGEKVTSATPLINVILDGLRKVHALDGDVRHSLESKQWIAEYVFSESQRTSAETAREAIRILGGMEEAYWNSSPRFSVTAQHSPDQIFSLLNGRLDDITPDKLRLLREMGIEEIPVVPKEAELEFPEYDSIKSLVRDLHLDEEMFGIARATQQLMSVMSLPRPMLRADQMEQGGFSDIANRGSLDRLLLSELAYDDLTLAVRVAVNEAMYLRREIPPSESQRRRVLLIDSGLRMWGVPRFLGTSVALALMGQLETKTDQDPPPFTAYTASGQDLQEVDLRQRVGIAEHLKTLRPELDPSGSFSALEQTLDGFEEAPEVVVITSPEALRDVNFRDRIAALALRNPGSYFVVTVARDGETQLNEITRSGCKLLQQVKFDLERVFANPPISKDKPISKLPAIFGVEPFPLLLPYQCKYTHIWPVGTEMMLGFSADSRLMLSTGANQGGTQLSARIKRASCWWFSREPVDSIWYSIVGAVQTKDQFRLICFNQDDLSVKEISLELRQQPIAFCNHEEAIFCIGKKSISLIDKLTGMASVNRLDSGDKIHLGGRYFSSRESAEQILYALASDGLAPKFERLPDKSLFKTDCQPFDSTAIEGTVGVFESGHLYFWATGSLLKIQHGLKDEGISVDEICHTGNTIIVRGSESKRRVKIDVETGEAIKPPGALTNFLPMQIQRLVNEKSLRTKLRSIAIHDGKYLSLQSRKQPRINIRLTDGQIRLVPNAETGDQHSRINFVSEAVAIPARFKLKVARWKDGSEAWLDSRGLLHLKSSDQDIPELTLVLTNDAMGGWLSNGRVWGDSFFLPADSPVHATNKYVMDVIRNFTTTIASRC